jgi:hypothetical protein
MKSHHKIDRINFEQLCWPEGWRAWMPRVTMLSQQSLYYSGLPALHPSGRTMCGPGWRLKKTEIQAKLEISVKFKGLDYMGKILMYLRPL